MSALTVFVIIAVLFIFIIGSIILYYYFRLIKKKDTSESPVLINFAPENESMNCDDSNNPNEEMMITGYTIKIDKKSGLMPLNLITSEEVGIDGRKKIKYIPKARDIIINFPENGKLLNEEMQKSICGKCFMKKIEDNRYYKDLLDIKEENIVRLRLLGKITSGGELSREDISRVEDLKSQIVNALADYKEKKGGSSTDYKLR